MLVCIMSIERCTESKGKAFSTCSLGKRKVAEEMDWICDLPEIC